MSNYYEDIMPISTNEDEYLKYYIDESLSLFDKLNSIIKKGEPFQRQALITNLNAYARDSLFSSLIQFIIGDIGTWDVDSIVLFPKSLYKIIINNKLANELFNIILKHMLINVSTGADITKNEYTFYFDKIIEFYSPTKDYLDTNNNNNNFKKEFPYTINDDIFEFIISLGKFGQSTINRRLCCYLSSSLCRLIIKDENNIQDDNSQKLYKRLSYLFCDGEKMIELQMVRELQYIIPIFKDSMFNNEDIKQAIECYIKHDTEHVSQSMTLITLLNNILNIGEQKYIIEILLLKIKEIIEVKEYEIIYKNDIMNNLINCLYNNYELIPKIINKIFELEIIEYYINNFDCLESINIFIINFDKIYFLLKNFNENYITPENSANINVNVNQTQGNTPVAEVKYQNKIQFDELFIKIYNKLYNDFESSETSSSNLLSIEPIDTLNTSLKDKDKEIENTPLNESKKLLFQNLPKIFPYIMPFLKGNKILSESFFDLFKRENIINILGYFYDKKLKNENKTKNNKFYKIITLLMKNNYKKYINNLNNNNNLGYVKEFIYENNYYNKIFLLILNNIFSQLEEIIKPINSDICLLLADVLNLLIPKIYKYYKNIVIIINNNNNNLNYVINMKENNNANNANKKNYAEKLFDEIFTKIISVIILNNNIGDYIKREYILIIPNLILYSKNRKTYLDFVRKEIIKSSNFFFRKYSIIFIKKCFEIFSFKFIYKLQLYDDILLLMKDNINIISTAIIDLIYKNNKKLIVYSPLLFQDICELLNEIYNININAFTNDIKNFDKEKNIIINQILNIKDANNNSKDKNNIMFYTEEELSSTKDNENILSSIENDILNLEINFEKNKNPKNNEQDGLNGNILQQINSTASSFQAIKNNVSNTTNHIPFISRGFTKKDSLSDKTASNIIKSLTSKNIGNNKHYLPKIKGQKIRKDSNSSNNSGNTNKNEQIVNINSKNGIKEKDKIISKNKSKLIPCAQNRTPSAKIHDGNHQNNNHINNNVTYDEISYKNNNYKINNRSISNKNVNINLNLKPYLNGKSLNLQKDFNNAYIHGNISNKIYINAEKTNTGNAFFK